MYRSACGIRIMCEERYMYITSYDGHNLSYEAVSIPFNPSTDNTTLHHTKCDETRQLITNMEILDDVSDDERIMKMMIGI